MFTGDLTPLLRSQNRDGGWGYQGTTSSTEPTALALLAQTATGGLGDHFAAGLSWLRRHQRPDGGWPPHPSVEESTWVTSLALLAVADWLDHGACTRGLSWLLAQRGRESGAVERLRDWLRGRPAGPDDRFDGWPWFPGTAAWVAPTAFAVLALEKLEPRYPAEVRGRLEQGRAFLLSRRCRDGGWNHGSIRASGREARYSYPETTGLALLALHGAEPVALTASVVTAERHLAGCRTAEGASWLELALRAHRRNPPPPAALVCRNVCDCALRVLASAAAAGAKPLWS